MLALLAFLAVASPQLSVQDPVGGNGVRVSTTVVSGGVITIHVGTGDDTVRIGLAGTSQHTQHHVPGNKDVSIPVPPVAPGSTLIVVVGKGKRKRRILVTVVAPTP